MISFMSAHFDAGALKVGQALEAPSQKNFSDFDSSDHLGVSQN